MAFTEIWQNVVDQWETLFKAELSPIPVYQSDVWEKSGTESIRLSSGETELLTRNTAGETRYYRTFLTYYLELKPGRTRLQQLRKAFNRINSVVDDNRDTTTSGYVFHDFKIIEAIINDAPEDGEPGLDSTGNVRMELQVLVQDC